MQDFLWFTWSKSFTESPDGSLSNWDNYIPDILVLKAELETLWDYLKEKVEGKWINTRIVADFTIQSHLKIGFFPSVARVYRLLLTAPQLVCKCERSFTKLKYLKKLFRSKITKERLDNLMVLSCEKGVTGKVNLKK